MFKEHQEDSEPRPKSRRALQANVRTLDFKPNEKRVGVDPSGF